MFLLEEGIQVKDAMLLAISEEYVEGVELLLQVGTQSGVRIGRANRTRESSVRNGRTNRLHSRLRLCY